MWRDLDLSVGTYRPQSSVGAWTPSIHHAYDPVGRMLYLGDGSKRGASSINRVLKRVAGGGTKASCEGCKATEVDNMGGDGLAVAPDGSLYLSSGWRVTPDGLLAISGTGGGTDVEMGPDGSLYFGGSMFASINRRDPNGTVTHVAGNGTYGYGGDGGPATEAALASPQGFAVGPDGSLYIADSGNARVRKVSPDGIINTIAGTGTPGHSGDGGPATAAMINGPWDVTLDTDGALYINEESYIRRVGPDGIITTVSGGGKVWPTDSALVTDLIINPSSLAFGPDGSLYFGSPAATGGYQVLRVSPDKTITIVAGNGLVGTRGENGPARAADGSDWLQGVAVDHQDRVYLWSRIGVWMVTPALPGFDNDSIVIPSEDGSLLYEFDATGRHLRTLNALTGAMLYQFAYDGAGRLTTIQRDGAGRPTAIIAPFGQPTSLSLDANGYLASVTNPAGESYRMTYTADGLLTQFQDPLNYVSTMTYDALGRLLKDENAAGGFTALARTDDRTQYAVGTTTAEGRQSNYQVGYLAGDNQNRLNRFPDGTQAETVVGTDGSFKTTLPDGTLTDTVETGDPRFGMQAPITKSATTTTGGLTANLTAQRTVSLSNPNNPLSLTNQTDTVTLNGRTATSVYTAASRTTTATSPMNRQSSVVTDLLGRPTQAQVGNLLPVNTRYDSHGRPSSTTQGSGADARTVGFSYNGDGYLDTVTDPLGRTVSYVYDAAGRVTTQTLPDGRQIQYGYDAKGNLTSLTPPSRPAHAFRYTAVDLTERYTPPTVAGVGDPSTTYTYNADKQLTQVNRPDGLTVSLAYDSAGRLSAQTTPDGTYRYAYNGAGQLSGVTAPDGGALTYSYSGSLLTQTAWSGTVAGSVSRTYDNDFRLASISVNGADPISYSYDNDSLLTQAGSLILSRRADDGLLAGTTLGTVSDTLSYSGFGEVTDYSATASGAARLAMQYTHDKLGRITQKVETVLGVATTYAYSYDTAGRLVGVTPTGASPVSYDYDANGNRLSKTVGGVTVNGTYDDQDRLTQYGATTYAYTANGELQSKTASGQTTTYQYDVLGNLRHVVLPDGRTLDYVIDGNNRRVGKKVNNVLTQGFLYQDGLKPIAELDGNNQVVSHFVYATGVNVPDYMVREGVTYRILTDHLGSPRLVVNVTDGSVIQRMDYDEFGNVTQDTNPGFQPFGFAGGLYDRDTKLVRFGARDYDAETGRWTAKDPILFGGGDTNLYTYVGNNPVNTKPN